MSQAKIIVREEGTEAAAVTGIVLGTRIFIQTRPRVVLFNRPFFLVILDLERNLPLFIGKIADPGVENTAEQGVEEGGLANRINQLGLMEDQVQDDSIVFEDDIKETVESERVESTNEEDEETITDDDLIAALLTG